MDEDPPFTVMGFISGLAVGGVIAGALFLLAFGVMSLLPLGGGDGRSLTSTLIPTLPPSLALQPTASPTATPSPAALPPRATVTGAVETATSTPVRSTPTASPTTTPEPTQTSTASPTPSPTAEATATPTASPVPIPTATPGPPDLAVEEVTVLPGGRIRAVLTNRGQGDIAGLAIIAVVFDQTTRSESLSGGVGLKAGASVVVESTGFTISSPTLITVTVDPSASINDANRANNSLSTTLTP